MKLENRFTVPASADTAWNVLLDVERIAPCMPGATLTEVAGDEFTGKVKVKLGPINLTYGGTARIVSRDGAGRVAVIEGSGKETRGTGTARATITCRLHERAADSTDVEVDTDLTITGKPAQFGRGVLADVSAKLIDQFAACLAEEIRSDVVSSAGRGTAPGMDEQRDGQGSTTGSVEPGGRAGTAGDAEGERMAAAVTDEPSDGPDATAIDGPVPPSGDGVGAGADGAAAAAALVAAEARERAQEVTGGGSSGAAPPSGTTGLAAGSDGPGVPVTTREASPQGARQATDTSPRVPRARPRQSAEAIDLLGTAGAPVAKRAVPLVLGVVVLAVVIRRLLR